MTQQWISLLLVGIIMGFLLGGSFARRSKGDKWNVGLGIAFAMVGVLTSGNLVIVSQKQRAAFAQSADRLACISQVVEAARSNTGYNGLRDAALLKYLAGDAPLDDLRNVLAAPPPPLPACDINWQAIE